MNSTASAIPDAFDEVTYVLGDHNVAFFLAPGDVVQGNLTLRRGALIQGEVLGDVISDAGSVIVTAGGVVRGSIEAQRIFIEGAVCSAFEGQSLPRLVAPELISVSSTANVQADLFSNAFSIHATQLSGRMNRYEDAFDDARVVTQSASQAVSTS